MANQNSVMPLYEKYWYKHSLKRVLDSFMFFLFLLLLGYRVISLLNNFTFHWFIAFICESWLTISWIFTFTTCWTPALVKTYPERLLHRMQVEELPPVDLFVTTADPVLEPPIITVNTVLSLLALDYPSNKLACYVSDDGCSPLTFYALQEASHFAKFWVPFCKKYKVQVRAPFRYFSSDTDDVESEPEQQDSTPEFKQEWLKMKDLYDKLSHRIEEAARTSSLPCNLDSDFGVFSNTEPANHPTIIKVIWENKESLSDEGLPHLIYISREKRPKHPHHFKAGAMNVLTRVSALITNAPFTLNVDCDMFVNNPKIVLHAMCILLDPKGEKEVAFVQCPQKFYGALKDDPLGNQLAIVFKYLAGGLAGLQGPFYGGTNCFHRRKVIYGLSPDNVEKGNNMTEKELTRKFGDSKELVKAAAHALEGKTYNFPNNNISNNSLKAANQVADCAYDYGTGWGDQIGWIYGTITEDVLTGLTIHRKGWRSEMCTPQPFAFTGCAPVGLPASLKQQKRWATGMLEIFFSKHSPVLATIYGKLCFRQFLAYMWIINWGFQPLFEVCYACLLTYSIITNSNLFPQGPALWIPSTLVIFHLASTLIEYLVSGLSVRTWWNNQRMSRINIMSARFCGFISTTLKFLRISNTVFDITRKDQNNGNGENGSDDASRFTFDESPVFIPGTTILLLQLTAMVLNLLESIHGRSGFGVGEMFCSAYLIICHWPFLKGLFERGKYGIPLSIILKSASLTFLFVQLCRRRVILG